MSSCISSFWVWLRRGGHFGRPKARPGVAAKGRSDAPNRRGSQASPSCGATRVLASASYAASWPKARLRARLCCRGPRRPPSGRLRAGQRHRAPGSSSRAGRDQARTQGRGFRPSPSRYLKDIFESKPGSEGVIRGYRGGYLPLKRREIERGLHEGSVLGVVSTNALYP